MLDDRLIVRTVMDFNAHNITVIMLLNYSLAEPVSGQASW
jgi:hypothetical protein